MATLRKTGNPGRRGVSASKGRPAVEAPEADVGGLFLREHRKDRKISADKLGQKLGIDRVSVYRIEKKRSLDSAEKQKDWAAALGIRPEELWRHPDDPSLDRQISKAPPDVQESVQTILKRLLEAKKPGE